jgi:hypothetical protein
VCTFSSKQLCFSGVSFVPFEWRASYWSALGLPFFALLGAALVLCKAAPQHWRRSSSQAAERRLARRIKAPRAPSYPRGLRRFLLRIALAAAFGAADQFLGARSSVLGAWATEASLLSAPWLLVAFGAGWSQPTAKRAAIGFAMHGHGASGVLGDDA